MKTTKKFMLIFIAVIMTISLTACGGANDSKTSGDKTSSDNKNQTETFPKFQGKDFDGNDVDDSLFGKNEATLLNFWFNGCSACVNEMPALEKFNDKLKEKGAELIGVNVQVGEDEEALKEAKEILSKQGVTYRNIIIDDNQEARGYISKIFTFPTTIIVDKKGNIIGQPIVGSIESEEKMEEILKTIDDIKSGKEISSSAPSQDTGNDKVASLLAEENAIFGEHKVWDKLFAKIQKDEVKQSENTSYVEFLKSQIEASKDSFTEDELNTLNEDLKKIEEIEMQIQNLNK